MDLDGDWRIPTAVAALSWSVIGACREAFEPCVGSFRQFLDSIESYQVPVQFCCFLSVLLLSCCQILSVRSNCSRSSEPVSSSKLSLGRIGTNDRYPSVQSSLPSPKLEALFCPAWQSRTIPGQPRPSPISDVRAPEGARSSSLLFYSLYLRLHGRRRVSAPLILSLIDLLRPLVQELYCNNALP